MYYMLKERMIGRKRWWEKKLTLEKWVEVIETLPASRLRESVLSFMRWFFGVSFHVSLSPSMPKESASTDIIWVMLYYEEIRERKVILVGVKIYSALELNL